MACSTPPMYWSMGNQYCAIFESNGASVVVRVSVAIEIPGRIDERVHGIGLAARRAATLGTGRVDEPGQFAERRSTGERDLHIFRQNHRQIFFGHGDDSILLAIKHGDGRAPIALARNSPVFQAISDGGLAESILLGERGHLLDRIGALEAAVRAGIDQHALVRHKRKRRLGDGFLRSFEMGRTTRRISSLYFFANS